MTAGDAVPEAVEAIDADVVDVLVARRRSLNARLGLTARTAIQRRERAEALVAARPALDADAIPADMLAVVDAMLERAVAASRTARENASQEASALVAVAVAESADALRRAGLDPSVLPLPSYRSGLHSAVVVAPTAADVWRRIQPSVLASAAAPSTAPPASPVAASWPPPSASVTATPTPLPPVAASPSWPPPGPDDGPRFDDVFGDQPIAEAEPDVFAGLPPMTVAAPLSRSTQWETGVATLLAEPAPLDSNPQGSAEVYDIFWQEATGERRVRDRLLRRFPKEGA